LTKWKPISRICFKHWQAIYWQLGVNLSMHPYRRWFNSQIVI
jgi:hypothetical protein